MRRNVSEVPESIRLGEIMNNGILFVAALLSLAWSLACGPNWRKVTSESFSIDLPAAPEIAGPASDSEFGENWRWYKATANFDAFARKPSANYMVGAGTAKDPQTVNVYITRVDDFLLKQSGTLIGTTPIEHQGCQGKEREFRDGELVVRARGPSCGLRFFALVAMGTQAAVSDGERFFASFRVTK